MSYVMYNLGPEWNLHVFAHDEDFVKTSLKNSVRYKLHNTPYHHSKKISYA